MTALTGLIPAAGVGNPQGEKQWPVEPAPAAPAAAHIGGFV